MNYLENLSATPEEKDAKLIPLHVDETSLQLDVFKNATKLKMKETRITITKLKSIYPLNFEMLINAIDEMQILDRRLVQLDILEKELFS